MKILSFRVPHLLFSRILYPPPPPLFFYFIRFDFSSYTKPVLSSIFIPRFSFPFSFNFCTVSLHAFKRPFLNTHTGFSFLTISTRTYHPHPPTRYTIYRLPFDCNRLFHVTFMRCSRMNPFASLLVHHCHHPPLLQLFLSFSPPNISIYFTYTNMRACAHVKPPCYQSTNTRARVRAHIYT